MNKILIDCILCFLGIIVYFLNRYANRKLKTNLSLKYWWNDNWPELSTTVVLNIALMILIHLPETYVSVDKLFEGLPFDLHVSGIPVLSFLFGLGLTATFYNLFKTKTAKKKS